jgi:hypothetical protein
MLKKERNLPINLPFFTNLCQSEHATNMNVKCELSKTEAAVKAPNSYAIVSTTCDKVPSELLHGNDLVPREIRYDLYQKIRTAKDKLELNCKYLYFIKVYHKCNVQCADYFLTIDAE